MRNKNFLNTRNKSHKSRKVDSLPLKDRFLIVCEGERTEPNYFRKFRVNKNIFELNIQGFGYNTIRLVEKAISLKQDGEYNQVWCVFDRDSFPPDHFNRAIELALRNDIRTAYSNEAFEIWYLLHFDFFNTGVVRADYWNKLSERIGRKYKKNDENIYDILLPLQVTAIKHAKRLMEQYDTSSPANNNPSTTVYQLVEELNKFLPGASDG